MGVYYRWMAVGPRNHVEILEPVNPKEPFAEPTISKLGDLLRFRWYGWPLYLVDDSGERSSELYQGLEHALKHFWCEVCGKWFDSHLHNPEEHEHNLILL